MNRSGQTADTTADAVKLVTIVTVKFRNAGKQYDFDTGNFSLVVNDTVVVETNRGRALGTVVRPPRTVTADEIPKDLKKVLRPATEADHNLARISAAKEDDAYAYCAQRIQQRNMPMKLVQAEYLFDGSKIIFYFTADGRVDFRELVKDLAHHFHTRIEMRQIGVRDEAKLVGGIGICGRELCCGTFLTDFHPVSVKMAKQQGLALNPTKISGQCGRLLCCLGYEYETYCSLAKKLPRYGTRVTVNGQPGDVVASQILNQTVTVRCEGKICTNVPLAQLSAKTADSDSKTAVNSGDGNKQAARPQQRKTQEKSKGGKSARKHDNRPSRRKGEKSTSQRQEQGGKSTGKRRSEGSKAPAAAAAQRPPKADGTRARVEPQTSTEKSTENSKNKNSRRRNRNRRRSPRKPAQENS